MSILHGTTRTRVCARHALLAPDGHVHSSVPGITGATVVVLISEAMGAKFSQLLVTFASGGRANLAASEIETVGYVVSGAGTLAVGEVKRRCVPGDYFFAPAGTAWSLAASKVGTQLNLFQKRYLPLAGVRAPKALASGTARVKGEPFHGDPDARLQVLLPEAPAFDLAVNIFTYQPGATLPFVETHIMEHGLLMLTGQGVYRLEDAWYPVAAGDAIWMAPYCRQWFAATGKQPARYLYYKDVNRPAL